MLMPGNLHCSLDRACFAFFKMTLFKENSPKFIRSKEMTRNLLLDSGSRKSFTALSRPRNPTDHFMLASRTDLPLWVLQTFRSLRSKNYRVYALSQLVSNCGTWIQLTVISWLVLDLTGSPFMLGLVNFLRLSPVAFLGFFGGFLADRFERKKILVWTKLIMFFQATLLGVLTISGHLETWHVLLLAFLLGLSNAIDLPAKQSITFNLVPKKDLINAVSLNTSSFHASRAVGPVIAIAIVYALGSRLGEGVCFILNGVSFLFVVWALLKIDSANQAGSSVKERDGSMIDGLKRCLSFVCGNDNVRTVFTLGIISSLLCMQYIVMMPVFAKTVLNREIDGYGFLMSGAALGSFLGAMLLANKARTGHILRIVIGVASMGFAVSLILFSLSTNFYLSVFLASFIGLFSTTQMSASNSMIQLEVEDSLRGKVLSVWMTFVVGIGPVGGVLVGLAATSYGAPLAMATCGAMALILSGTTLISARARQLRLSLDGAR